MTTQKISIKASNLQQMEDILLKQGGFYFPHHHPQSFCQGEEILGNFFKKEENCLRVKKKFAAIRNANQNNRVKSRRFELPAVQCCCKTTSFFSPKKMIPQYFLQPLYCCLPGSAVG